jgi:hypothetical protein
MAASTDIRSRDPLGARRWQVHLGLIVSFAVALSIVVAHMGVDIHIIAGLCFAALVAVHLVQRQRMVRTLAGSLIETPFWRTPRGRMALSDCVLAFLAVNVVLSGIADWMLRQPVMLPLPGVRSLNWHTTTSILLLAYLVVHIARRRSRFRHSHIR